MRRAVIIFTRVPIPGKTKTRLMPYLSKEECAALHKELIRDVCRACEGVEADILVFHTPEDTGGVLRETVGAGPIFFRQEGANLGERMEQAFLTCFGLGYESVVLVGTDIPRITAEILEQAFRGLKDHEIVINPTEDGGYYLIGMKEPHKEVWKVEKYGTSSVFAETVGQLRKAGLRTAVGEVRRDVDTKEDMTALCIHCGACTKSCEFLSKYRLDLEAFSKRPELAYSCFLCGRCRQVCPRKIDGADLALSMRRRTVEEQGGTLTDPAYRLLLLEKNPYKFSNYRKAAKSVLFPGCNFPSVYPKTMKRLEELMGRHGVGVVYDCCAKPVHDLGLVEDAFRNIREMEERLWKLGVEELILLCPNCYHFLRDKTTLTVTTVYKKLAELGEGERIRVDGLALYYPCPDREGKEMFQDAQLFLEGQEETPFADVQCCGLGACAAAKEPEAARRMTQSMGDQLGRPEEGKYAGLYTYCASCIRRFQRCGISDVSHILPMILGVEEKIPMGIKPFLHRVGKGLI